MANTTISPNMNLPIPTVGIDSGPDWATNVDSCLSIVDAHNHSTGNGVQITPSGLNISADLTINSNNLTSVRSTRYTAQISPLSGSGSDVDCTYVSGVDLWFNDGNGNQVQLTSGGNPAGGAGSISGLPSGTASASFSGGTFSFKAATNTPATMNMGPIVIGNATLNSKQVTIQPNSGIASNYNITLPAALSASTGFVTIDNAGQMTFSATGIAYNPASSGGTTGTVDGINGLKGFSDGSSATAGYVGETFNTTFGPGTYNASGAWQDSANFSLTAGSWALTHQVYFVASGATYSNCRVGISTTLGNSSSGLTTGDNLMTAGNNNGNGYDLSAAVSQYRINIASPTTFYAKLNATFIGGSPVFFGRFTAIRIR